MFYVKLASDGSVEQYPYTLTDLIFANRNVSFPSVITPDIVADFGLAPVEPTDPPAIDHTQNLTRGVEKLLDNSYAETWTVTDASAEEIADRTESESQSVRFIRNEALKNSDWTQLPDSPADSVVWAAYRQDLRDIPQQVGFPWTVTWPTEPA
jgi:hypothetical protein